MRLLGTINRYIGTATEVKPSVGVYDTVTGSLVTSNDLPAGSTYTEEDTGREWVYNGVDWEIDPRSAQTDRIVATLEDGFGKLLQEARRMVYGIGLQVEEDLDKAQL